MANLDLIVACDTTIAHLAGALGRPVWDHLKPSAGLALASRPRALPWYPARRLFRQKERGDWAEVFDRVARALHALRATGAG